MNQIDAITTNGAQLARPLHAHTAPSGLTILLVEDEAFVREVTSDLLEAEGFRVLKAKNAADARAAFRRHCKSVQLLLTDVVLPGENGRDLASHLRRLSPNLLIIFVSGYPVNAVTRDSVSERGMFYLPKPFSAETLLSKVRQVLRQENAGIHAHCR